MRNFTFTVFILINKLIFSQNPLFIPDTLTGTNFSLNIYDTSHVFYPGFTTQTFGVNASYLGPTLFMNKNDSVDIQLFNLLSDTTTIHWHGMHVSPQNDGGPHIVIPPGNMWNPKFKVRDHAAMYWYHPHLHMMTNLHASLGAAGLVIVRDSTEKNLALPRRYGIDDFPLVLQTKCFDASKQIVVNNAYDSVVVVNGTRNAFLHVPEQVLRFRLLNASSERVYNVGLQGNLTFYQIGSDGGLLDAPVALTRLRLSPGERAEILIDFTGKLGQSINLISFASELPNAIYGATQPGMGVGQVIPGYTSNPLNGSNFNLVNFQVVSSTAFPVTSIPATLVNNVPWNIANVNANKTLTFTPVNMGPTAIQGPFLINSTSFDMNTINYSIPLNNIEVWTLTNQSPIAHPFHIHDVQFYITDINGAAPPPNMAGRKDVVLVPAGQSVKFITKFETFCDEMYPYMYHCHMLPHEDEGMMGQFLVNCPVTGISNNDSYNNLTIYPNPTETSVAIKFSEQKNAHVIIYNQLGEMQYEFYLFNEKEYNLNIEKLYSGVYYLQVLNDEGNGNYKLHVQHR